MAKHIKLEKWLYFYELYNNKDYVTLSYELLKQTGRDWYKQYVQKWLKEKFRKYKKSNFDKNVFISKTGWAKKKGTNSGRPLKKKNKHMELTDFYQIGYDNLTAKQKIRIFKIVEFCKKNKQFNPIKKLLELPNVSFRKAAKLLVIPKSTLNHWMKYGFPDQSPIKDKIGLIEKIFFEHKCNVGREFIAGMLDVRYSVKLSPRQVGNIMNKLNLQCLVRKKKQSKRVKELKNTKVDIPDLVQRDYDNKFHDLKIIATDVSYLDAPKDCESKHVYFSAAIDHQSKKILGWSLSKNNDTNLVLKTFENINLSNCIIHSDHGSQYSSNIFQDFIKKRNWIQSMSRVGNCLDNREIEYFFGIMKSELNHQIKTNEYTFNELKQMISDWIEYYNNKRIKKHLGWKTPNQIYNFYDNLTNQI